MEPPAATESPAGPAAPDGGAVSAPGDEGTEAPAGRRVPAHRVLDPRVVRMVASAVPLDVLVCSDRELADDARPVFGEVHLLDPAGRPTPLDDEDGGPGGLVVHTDPVESALSRLGAELSGTRVLWALGAEHEPSMLARLGPEDVLLSEASSAELDLASLGDTSGRELIDLEVGVIAGPALLRPIVAPLFGGAGTVVEPAAQRGEPEAEPALARAEQLVARLRERNQELEERIGELRHALTVRRRKGPFGRLAQGLSHLRARLRPIYGVRLGLLWHYHPRTLRVPDRYRRESPPADVPRVSIVVPSYNQGGFIARTLDSVLDQAYPELELIVQDGGSSDETLTVLDAYADRLAHVHSGPDAGQAAAINAGFQRSSGEVMAWLNSDDVLLPGTLAYVGRWFAEHPDVDVVYGHRVLIDTDDREIGRWVMPSHDDEILSWADYVPQETMFWRRSIWEKAGARMTEEYRFALDWELLVRFREAGARIVRLPRFLGAFRIHEEQKSSAQVETVGHGEMERLRRHIHGRRVRARETQKAIRPYLRRHLVLDKLWRLGLIRH